MDDLLRIFLPVYFIIYFIFSFFLKSFIVAKKIGKSPIVLPKNDSTYWLIWFYFKIILIFISTYILIFSLYPSYYSYFFPIFKFENFIIKYTWFVFLLFSLIWTIIAQWNMKNSWRVWIDLDTKTDLITIWFFKYSRNPIFFCIILNLIWLFLITPNMITFIFLILWYILIQIQIRLEEEFLFKEHWQKYLNYKQKVRRFL